jgi:hypothetical protein
MMLHTSSFKTASIPCSSDCFSSNCLHCCTPPSILLQIQHNAVYYTRL